MQTEYETLPGRFLAFWETLACLGYGGLAAAAWRLLPPESLLWYVALWVLGGLFILTALLYLPLLYLNYEWRCTKTELVVRTGVIFYQTRLLKRDKISFVTLYNTPLSSLLRWSCVVVTAPGSRIVLPFLSHERAVRLARELGAPRAAGKGRKR